MLTSLAGRIAIVTGGSSGIGREACLALGARGGHVVAVGRDPQRLAETAELVRARGGTAEWMSLDVRSEADMQAMAARVLAAHGRIDILVASAGILRAPGAALRTVAQTPVRDWDEVAAVNLRGTFLSNRAVLPAMIRQRSGDIINLSSLSGRVGIAFDAPYCASKFGVIGLSEALAEEVGPLGVRVQSVLPGTFLTPVWSQTGPLPRPEGLPPASRVAELIATMVLLPRDTHLGAVMIEPVLPPARTGWRQGAEASRRAAAVNRRSLTVSESPDRVKPIQEQRLMSHSTPGGTGRLDGRVVIVTGGTGGIGRATARAAAVEGASIVAVDVAQPSVDELVEELGRIAPVPAGHLGLAVDIRDEAACEGMAQATLERFGKIDALVACAGILRKRGTPPKPVVKTGLDEWEEVLAVNLRGTFLCNRAVLPSMIARRSGTIINISSVSGLKGRAHDAPYCASKFGVIGLSQSVADEVRSYGIRVQAIMPEAIATPMWDQNHPMPPPGDALPPERVADLILFMLTQPEDTMLVGPVIAPVGARRRRLASAGSAAEQPTTA
jgi:3-oxoacyl-[acyl-carrier protein] reductase